MPKLQSKGSLKIAMFLLVCLWLGIGVNSKVFDNAFLLNSFTRNQGWSYIGRMNVHEGKITMSLKISLKFVEEHNQNYILELVGVPATLWTQQLQNKCQLSKYSSSDLALKKEEEIILKANLSKSTGYNAIITKLVQVPQQRLYNFIIRDCADSIIKLDLGRRAKVQYRLDVRSNEQHLSVNQHYYSWVLPLLMVLSALAIVFLRKEQEQDQNWVKYLLKISLWVSIGSLVSKYIGYLIYASTGYSYQFFEVVYLLVHSVSDSIVLVLLVMLAFGWTVTFLTHRDLDVYIPLGCMCGFIYMILTLLNKITEGHDKYHMFDTIPAYLMILFRIMVFCLFVYAVIRTYARCPEAKMRGYFVHLGVMGSVFIIVVPVAVLVVQFVQEEHREYVFMLGLQMTRLVLFLWLAVLSGWKASSYRKVINTSFMQRDQKYY